MSVKSNSQVRGEVPSFSDVIAAFDRLRDLIPTIRDLGHIAFGVKDGLGELTGVTLRYVAHEAKSRTASLFETAGHRAKWRIIDIKQSALKGLKSFVDDSPHLGDR